MSATVFSLPSAVTRRPNTQRSPGTASASASAGGVSLHRSARVLHAVKIYVASAFEVATLGEYTETVSRGIRRWERGA
jgi:hypothetical protein